jgi:hypothetical protein
MQKHDCAQTRCRAAMRQIDITPPIGIYHRMWGAAKHDQATSIHRPLTATMLWMAPLDAALSHSVVIVSLDHCILDALDIELFQKNIGQALDIPSNQVQICLTHTHAAGLMSRSRIHHPGGDMIVPYLDSVAVRLGELANSMRSQLIDATIIYGIGRCNLARERDYWDVAQSRFVCGFNPHGFSDDYLVVAKIVGSSNECLGTVVNYACHPTTLAWDNRAISPDYVGAMREVVEGQTQAPCLFLQGASGDLGPLHGFVGDVEVADRNGRWLGYAALSAMESLSPAHKNFDYAGAVVSGTLIGTWKYVTRPSDEMATDARWKQKSVTAHLPYRHDLPCLDDTRKQLAQWNDGETAAKRIGDEASRAHCRAMAEQMQRQIWRQESLPQGKCFPLAMELMHLGQSHWLFVPGEHYQVLQTTLRLRFPNLPWIIATIANGWQPGYVPPASKYGYGIYQEQIAVIGPGSEEMVIETISRSIQT